MQAEGRDCKEALETVDTNVGCKQATVTNQGLHLVLSDC